MYTTLITPQQLQHLQASGQPLMVFDCSFDLANPAAGRAVYLESHLPAAIHVDLDRHLSAKLPQPAASGGRHPLPLREDFARSTLQQLGFGNAMQAVVYDRNGCNYCGRLWWMLKWLGHEAVAVLDGGLPAWQQAGLPLEAGCTQPQAAARPFAIQPPLAQLRTTADLVAMPPQSAHTLIDSRGAPRYRGEVEPLDPVAGHIPGALNRPFTDNFAADGRFKPAQQLRAEFDQLLQGHDPAQAIVYCGSGVSAVPNVLAFDLAGLPRPALYAGSWSDWCTTRPALPVEKG